MPLSPCELTAPGKADPVPARCGTLEVFEDRAAARGRTISLRVAVVPASGARAAPDPVFLLAGGPGQAITQVFPELAPAFARVNVQRDLVLVDQRGTGGSGALRCDDGPGGPESRGPDEARERAARCAARLQADARQYTTAEAMDDLDDVRAALGYERIDLWGGSYGTRAALAYVRQHPDRVRAVVLDGVAPPDEPLPLAMAAHNQAALDRTLARCQADPSCQGAFPDLAGSLAALLARVDQRPEALRVPHPVTAHPTDVTVDRASLSVALRLLSFFSEGAALVPLLVHHARHAGDLRPIAAQILLARGALDLSVGMQLSVLCSEDDPFYAPEDAAARSRGTYAGDELWRTFRAMCSAWPRAALRPGARDPVTSKVPTLLLSGEIDPVTPPSGATRVASTLSRSLALVVPGEAHGVTGRGCAPRLVAAFYERGGPEGLDASCLASHRPMGFFTSFAGPRP